MTRRAPDDGSAGGGAAPAMAAPPKRRSGRPKRQDAGKAEIERQERVAQALRLRATGLGYQRIADTMGVALSTAYGWVQAGLASIPDEQAEEIRRLALDQCAEMMQRLMPLLADSPLDVLDDILAVQARILQLHGIAGRLGGRGEGDDGAEESEAILIQRIRAAAPVLRPDGVVPANPIL